MAKYQITHTCGHQVTVQLFGAMKDRERRIEYLQQMECEECRIKKANTESAAAADARGLAELSGSEKQISWANTIRENAYKCLDALEQFATNEQAQSMMDSWKTGMNGKTEAKWWIENRYNLPSDPYSTRESVSKFNELFK